MRWLLGEHIDSVEQLEVLLLLFRHRDRAWTDEQTAEELRSSATSTAKRLKDLTAAGLASPTEDGNFHYAPKDERRERAVEALALAYGERPYTVIELIFSKPIKNLRVYADAFRFKKEDDDG